MKRAPVARIKKGDRFRLPWWLNGPEAMVVGKVGAAPWTKWRLIGLNGVIRGRLLVVRNSRMKKAKPVATGQPKSRAAWSRTQCSGERMAWLAKAVIIAKALGL